jgi:flagellar biosynthesis/type III secretory pathway M-ring protein FliF/YscJ
MDLLNRAFLMLNDRFRSLAPGSRLTAGLLAVAVLFGLGYLSMRQSAIVPDADLMHGVPISAAQLPIMEAALAKANLKDYVIQGNSIRVPRGQEGTYMMALADAKALPSNIGDALSAAVADGSWFEYGSKSLERMKIARQDVLSQMIRSMSGIESAYVLYDIDTKPGFNKDKVITATASVKPVGTEQIDEARVASIRHLVAGAIANLKPENVTVCDLNGRTWYGKLDESGANGNYYVSQQRIVEQNLKAKILNVLWYIPSVTVETSVELARTGLTPTSAKVSVGVPTSYFEKIRQERNSGGIAKSSDPAALEQIRIEESAKIQRHVAQLLPAADSASKAADLVTVTSFHIPVEETRANAFGSPAWDWAQRSWPLLATIALAMVGLLALRTISRGGVPAKASSLENSSDDADSGEPSIVPAPHARGFYKNKNKPAMDNELSELVADDPDAAANVLRTWIGHSD